MRLRLFIFLLPFTLICAFTNGNERFLQEIATVFTVEDGLPETVFSGLRIDESGNIIAVSALKEYIFKGERWEVLSTSSEPAGTEDMKPYENVLSYTRYQQKVFIGKKDGLYMEGEQGREWIEIYPSDGNYSWKLSHVNVLLSDSRDRLWFGSNEGVGFLQKEQWKLFTGKEGLPVKKFTCIAEAPDGEIWFGTEKGAVRTDGKEFYYRFSRRWLPDDHVNDILVEEDGTTWLATNKGISRISFLPMTLEEKAELFTEQVESRHNRMGFIAQNSLKVRYDPESWEPAISDNDGMYTAMYGAAQAFRYASTRSPEAKRLAKRSFDACKWLADITHEKGFPARVIIPVDWPEPVNKQYDHEYNIRKQQEDPFWKDIIPRFVKSKDGKYLWKCDTSSDELAGHYFFYGIYYDLLAETEEEKTLVREVVADITDHLIRHGFYLQDHDGKATRWANFSPEFFNSVWGWDQRGLNSMMMLSFLNVAHHVTGDPKYLETAEMLRDKYHYHINAMLAKMYFPPEDVVPWDNNLCLMSFYGLLNYEKDPELIMMYRESLENAWLHISKQKSAFWNVLYYALAKKFNVLVDSGIYSTGKYFSEAGPYAEFTAREFYRSDFNTEDILETLQRLPLDLIGYRMDNRHRLDIVFDPTPGQAVQEGWRPHNPERPDNTFEMAEEQLQKTGWHVNGKALPIDERCHVRLDRDGFVLDATEGSAYSEHEGTIYLLPYYMAVYHGLIDRPGSIRLKHNNPALITDLGVGLWANPIPLDWDQDGDTDLLVSTPDKPSNGLYLFENDGNDLFSPGRWVAEGKRKMTVSWSGDKMAVCTPGTVYQDFRDQLYAKPDSIAFKQDFHSGRANQWKYADYNGDGIQDLIIGVSDWREYGWDDAYNAEGMWTNGPLHGYVYLVLNHGSNESPDYGKATKIQAGGKALDVYGKPSPNLVDWDKDGDLDLICGEFLDRISYFENTGSRTEPVYAAGRFLQLNGHTLHLELEMPEVVVFDWDHDDDPDIIVGKEDGRVVLIENRGMDHSGLPLLAEPLYLKQRAAYVKCGALSTPCSYDWDGDGDEDIIAGNTAGYIEFIENLDGGDPPAWAAPIRLNSAGETFRIMAGPNLSIQGPAEAKWGYTVPYVADWNMDGLPDIVLNSIVGKIIWIPNVGSRTEPVLAEPLPVRVDWQGSPPKPAWNWWDPEPDELVVQWRTRPLVLDLNEDGLQDLVVIDHEGYLSFFQRKKSDDGLVLMPGQRIFYDVQGNPLQLNPKTAGGSGRRKIDLVDWDGDGDLDLLANSKNTELYRNTGKEGEYIFQNEGDLLSVLLGGHSTSPTTLDWNKDGMPDLLIGAEDGFFYYLSR